jgi:hypothetical protein
MNIDPKRLQPKWTFVKSIPADFYASSVMLPAIIIGSNPTMSKFVRQRFTSSKVFVEAAKTCERLHQLQSRIASRHRGQIHPLV